MTPHEKAVNAINVRLERLQANLRDAGTEVAQRFLFQSIVVTIGVSDALNDYIRMVGSFAQRRHGELKQANDALAARHTELMKSGQEWLEKLKANPRDKAMRKEIETAQKNMEQVQKSMRRAAYTLQGELAPGLALIDEMAASIRRLCEANSSEGLKRILREIIGLARGLYATRPVPERIDAPAWEQSAAAAVDQSAEFQDAYARAGHQATVALELMAMAWSDTPPQTAAESVQRADESAANRLKAIAARYAKT